MLLAKGWRLQQVGGYCHTGEPPLDRMSGGMSKFANLKKLLKVVWWYLRWCWRQIITFLNYCTWRTKGVWLRISGSMFHKLKYEVCALPPFCHRKVKEQWGNHPLCLTCHIYWLTVYVSLVDLKPTVLGLWWNWLLNSWNQQMFLLLRYYLHLFTRILTGMPGLGKYELRQ